MPLTIVSWQMINGQDVPEPILKDDSGLFPDAVVREVRQWLVSMVPEERKAAPTPILISLGISGPDPVVTFKGVPWFRVHGLVFQHGQFEIIFRESRTKVPLVKYKYVGARAPDGKVIIGAKLWQRIVGQITV